MTWQLDGRDLVNPKAGVALRCTPSGHTLDHCSLVWRLEATIDGHNVSLPLGRRLALNDIVAEMRKQRRTHDTRRGK